MTRDIDSDLPEYPDGAGYQRHSEASKDGARVANPQKPTQEALCLRYLHGRGRDGGTADEVSEAIGVELYIVRARLAGLHKRGLIFAAGRRMGGHRVKVTAWAHSDFRPPAPPDAQGALPLPLAA